MTDYQKIKATLESPGMKLIVAELKRTHRNVYGKYRKCGSMDELLNLQTLQKVIDTELPRILNHLMNRHVDPKTPPKSPDWWRFDEWFNKLFR